MSLRDSLAALSSLSALTVTVCAADQFDAVKVSWLPVSAVPEMVRAVLSWPVMVTVTAPAGACESLTV